MAQSGTEGITKPPPAASGEATRRKPLNPYPWLRRKTTREPIYPEILVDPAWLRHRLTELGLLPLDLRSAERYRQGHLPGARRLAWEAPLRQAMDEGDPHSFRAWLADEGLDASRPLLLYGDEQSTALLGRFFWALAWAGLPEPLLLDGGIAAWARRGGRLDHEAQTSPAPVPSSGEIREELAARHDWVLRNMGDQEHCEILDLRGAEAWAAPVSAGKRRGHLPHSLPYDFEALLPGDGRWPSGEELRKEFANLGPRPRDFVDLDAEFILYGEDNGDARPGLGYLLLRMMDVRARVLLGGWAGWASERERPVVSIISVEELAGMLRREQPELSDEVPRAFAFFDLRGHRDFRLGHLPGATALPANTVDDSLALQLRTRWRKLDPDRDALVFYCYGPECVRSRIAATKAAGLGWRRLLIFRGGVSAWREAKLPLPGGGEIRRRERDRRRGR